MAKKPEIRSIYAVQVFTVGYEEDDDFTPEEIELLVFRVRDWYVSEGRNFKDPLQVAKDRIDECLSGRTKDGAPWKNAPKKFESRVKAKTGYDINEPEEHTRARNSRVTELLSQTEEERAKNKKKANKAHRASQTQQNPQLDSYLEQYQAEQEQEILAAYPELDTPAHRPNVERLALLYATQKRISLELPTMSASARSDAVSTLSTLQRSVSDTMKALDIYPDQIRKRTAAQTEGSVGDLVMMIDDDDGFKKREKLWSLTLALQLWWMTQHLNGRGDGPQISEFEMWHMTRTRPIHYECECGKEVTLVEGFTPEELKKYLIDNGVLVETPVIPNYMTEEDLDGLQEFGSEESPGSGEDLHEGSDGGGEQAVEEVPESPE